MSVFEALPSAWPQADLEAALLTSYTFDASFFESCLFPVLQRRGARPVIVFVDHRAGLQPNARLLPLMRYAGVDYHLVPIDLAPFAFHPKVHFFTGPRTALVGSGNLTWSGCGGNLEAFDRLDPTRDGQAVGQVIDFFSALLRRARPAMTAESASRVRDLLTEIDRPAPTGLAQFVSSVDGPLWPRLDDALEAMRDPEVWLAAPFHDRDHRTSCRLAERLGARRGTIASDGRAPGHPAPDGMQLGFVADDARRLHAKLVHARDDDIAQLVTGSANLTRAGFSIGGRGNLEAVVLRPALDPDAFVDLLGAVEFTACGWPPPNGLEPEPGSADGAPLPAFSADLRGDRIIVEGLAAFETVDATLEGGARRRPIALRRAGPLWRGPMPFAVNGPVVLHVCVPDHAVTSVVVHQTDILSSSGVRARIWRTLRALEADETAWHDRRELLACFADALALLLEPSADDVPQRGDHPVSTARGETKGPGFDASDERITLDDAAFIASPASTDDMADRLVGLARAIGRPGPPDDDAPEEPPPASGAGDATSEGAGQPEIARRQAERRNADAVLADGVLTLWHRSRPILDASNVPLARRRGIYRALLILLVRMISNSAYEARAVVLARTLVDLLHDAWAGRPWPGALSGWLATVVDADLRGEALIALAHGIRECRADPSTADAPDTWIRALRAIEDAPDGLQLPERWRPPDLLTDYAHILDPIRARTPRSDAARQTCAALWAIEMAARRVDRLADETRDLKRRITKLQQTRARLAPRNPRHRRAVEQLAQLEPQMRATEQQLHAARAALSAARRAGSTVRLPDHHADASVDDLWWKAGGRRRGGVKMKVWARTGAVCPACRVTLPSTLWAASTDPARVVNCSQAGCGALIVPGPAPEANDG